VYENLNYKTLLSNLVYLFCYCDYQKRISLVSKESESNALERIEGKVPNYYKDNIWFNIKSCISDLELMAYRNILRGKNIEIESIIEWFFKEFLLEKFNINEFVFNAPQQNLLVFEKCRFVAPEIEGILRQYELYVENGKIEDKMRQLSSKPLEFENIKSLVSKKYIYAKDHEEYKNAAWLMFSYDCLLACYEDMDYFNFNQLLANEIVHYSSYEEHRKPMLDWLLEHKYIRKENDILKNDNLTRLEIFRDLYLNEVISYHNCELEKQREIDNLLQLGILESDSTLFSRPEQFFLNYVLKSTFENSLELRNKYVHGTQPSRSEEKEHWWNYNTFLKLILIIIIKIHDDLSIDQKLKQRDLNQNSQI